MARPTDRSSHLRDRRPRTQIRRRSLALEGLEGRQLLTSTAYNLFDTGVDNSGNLLSAGASDTHYTMPVTQQGTAGQSAIVTSAQATGWTGNSNSSQWIAPVADQSNANNQSPAGTYIYETTATVATAGKGFIQGYIAADDSVAISINGTPTTFSASNAMGSLNSFKVFGDFVAGTNTIDFSVTNGATGPTALQVNNLTLDMAPTVAVDQPTITVAYGGTLTATGTFADPDAGDTVSITSNRANGQISPTGTQSGTYTLTENNVTQGGTVTITGTDSQGNITTNTFNLVVTPPSLTAGGQTMTNRANSTPTLVDPNLVLTDPNGPNLTSASISIGTNFTAAEDRLLFTNQNGITGAYNTSTGILTLSGSATPVQYQAALRSVAYQNINTDPTTVNTAPRTINFSIAPGTFNPTNGHFYQFVRNPGITWTDAKAAADASSLYGLQGYLATLTSAAENTFAFSKTQSTGWIGASDANTPGDWKWVDGPETGLEFWQGDGTTGAPVNGQYSDWNQNEPNNSGNVEFYAQYLQSGLWNDLANTATVNGYLIEYGGSQGDPTLELTSEATMNVVSQTAAPTVTSPLAAVSTNAQSSPIAGSAQVGSLVQVYLDANNNGVIDGSESVVASEQLSAAQTDYSINVPLEQNATSHFLVTATADQAAESDPVVVAPITQDSIAPIAPDIYSPAALVSVNTTTASITGSAEAGSLIQVYRDANGNGVVDGGDVLVGFDQLTAASTTFEVSASLTMNSANNLLVTSTDAAGNESLAAAVPTITQDTVAPVAPTVTSPAQPLSTSAATVIIGGLAEAGNLITVYDDVDGSGTLTEGDTPVALAQLSAGQTTFEATVTLAENAANHFLVTSTDAAGNESPAVAVPTITQDTVTPSLPTVTSPSTPLSTTASTVTLSGEAEAGSLVNVYTDSNGNGQVDADDALAGSLQLAAGQTTYDIVVALGDNAANHFLVTSTDAAGNASAPTPAPTITNDTVAPVVPTLSSPTAPLAVADPTFQIAGTAEAGSLVRLYIDSDGDGVVGVGDTLVDAVALTSDQTDFAFTAALASNAANHFLVTSTDAAGNISVAAIVPTITNDTVAPAAPTVAPSTGGKTTEGSVTIAGSAEAGSLVQVFVDRNGDGLLDDGDTLVGQAQLASDQASYSIGVPLTPGIDNHFLVATTDAAGNRSSVSSVPTITQSAPVQGTVFLDLNHNGVQDMGESPLAGRVLYLDASGAGFYVPGDPTTVTDSEGHFVFADAPAGSATVGELVAQDTTFRYVVNTTTTASDGSVSIGATPYSPLMPMPTVGVNALNPTATDPNARYVQSLYQAVLGRNGSDAEVALWMSGIAQGMTSGQVATGFVNSPEHRLMQVAAYYAEFLHRSLDPGAVTWVNQLLAGVSEQDVARGILGSPEYLAAPATTSDLIAGLYRDVLGRQGSTDEVAAWDAALAAGLTKADMIDHFVGSAEANDQAVAALYSFALGRGREMGSSAYWTDQLADDATVSDVAIGILVSDEFQAKARQTANG